MRVTAAMSDEEIRENLLKLGQNIGPVVDSTRAFYRRKLARLLGEIKDEPVTHNSGTEGSASETEAKEEPVLKEKLFSDTYSPPTQIRGRRSVHATDRSPGKPLYRSSPAFNRGDSDHLNPAASTEDKKNLVMMLCFVVGFALILYFTLFSGDSSTTSIEST